MAISCEPAVLIADEPTTALDVTTEAQIMELLLDLQRQLHMGLVLITHNMGLAFTYGDEIAVMYAGQVVERASTRELLQQVRMPYTLGLLESVPKVTDAPHTRVPAMPGRPPDATMILPGCAFQPRCRFAQEDCLECAPSLEGSGTHYWACLHPL